MSQKWYDWKFLIEKLLSWKILIHTHIDLMNKGDAKPYIFETLIEVMNLPNAYLDYSTIGKPFLKVFSQIYYLFYHSEMFKICNFPFLACLLHNSSLLVFYLLKFLVSNRCLINGKF
jgi:hypothetical protein